MWTYSSHWTKSYEHQVIFVVVVVVATFLHVSHAAFRFCSSVHRDLAEPSSGDLPLVTCLLNAACCNIWYSDCISYEAKNHITGWGMSVN